MNKPFLLLLSILFISVITLIHAADFEAPEETSEWLSRLSTSKEKVTLLHFYFHDIVSGPNPTAAEVAQSRLTSRSPTKFGLVNMIDDPLTEGPDPRSKIVGRAQGLYGSAGLQQVGLLMAMNLVFTSGEFNGSSLAVLARNPVLQPHREFPIVGGTGVFRLARGFVTAKTYNMNQNGDAVVEYNVVVIHH